MSSVIVGDLTAIAQTLLALISVGAIVLSLRIAMRKDSNVELGRKAEIDQNIIDHSKEIDNIQKGNEGLLNIVNSHLIECARGNGRSEEMMKTLFNQQAQMQRSIEQLQAQLRLAVSDGANRFFHKDAT